MWGVKWLTSGSSDQAAGAAQPAAAAPQHGKTADDGKAAAAVTQTPTADPARKPGVDHESGHAAGQHGPADGSHVPPGASSLPLELVTSHIQVWQGLSSRSRSACLSAALRAGLHGWISCSERSNAVGCAAPCITCASLRSSSLDYLYRLCDKSRDEQIAGTLTCRLVCRLIATNSNSP